MYSKDLKERAVKYRSKHTQRETCEVFGISTYAIKSWVKQQRETGKLDKKPIKRSWRKIDPEKLGAYIKEHPDAFFHEIAVEFDVTGEGIRKACRRHKITIKKSD